MAEVRNMKEGELWWVAASGTGSTWATASAPSSGLFGYVRSMSYDSARTVTPVNERGVPTHFKEVSRDVIKVSVSFAWTGYHPTAVSGSGASMPMIHMEHKSKAPEDGNTGRYHQFHGVAIGNLSMKEGDNENTMDYTMQALAMNGVTGSGYLS